MLTALRLGDEGVKDRVGVSGRHQRQQWTLLVHLLLLPLEQRARCVNQALHDLHCIQWSFDIRGQVGLRGRAHRVELLFLLLRFEVEDAVDAKGFEGDVLKETDRVLHRVADGQGNRVQTHVAAWEVPGRIEFMLVSGEKPADQVQVSQHPVDQFGRLHELVMALAAVGKLEEHGDESAVAMALIDSD